MGNNTEHDANLLAPLCTHCATSARRAGAARFLIAELSKRLEGEERALLEALSCRLGLGAAADVRTGVEQKAEALATALEVSVPFVRVCAATYFTGPNDAAKTVDQAGEALRQWRNR